MRQLPHMNELHEKYASKGLHVVGLYAQDQPITDVDKVITDKKVVFPNATVFDFSKYYAPKLPKVWLIGVDGKIKYIGGGDYEKLLMEELAKVKRPGLGKDSVSPELEEAAKLLAAGKNAQALKLAQAVLENPDASEQALADAEYITERITDRVSLLKGRADAAEIQGEYEIALCALDELATDFKDVDGAEEAAERLAKLKGDSKVKAEIEASRVLFDLSRKLNADNADNATWIKELKAFEDKHKGTHAADLAAESRKDIEAESAPPGK